MGVISHFKKFAGVETAFEFVLATTHLFWDPKQEDVKLLQTQRMLRRLKQFTSSLDVPVIFAGDFNSLPDSKVYNFITAGPEHNYNSAYSQYVDPVSTSSGPNEPSFTNVNGASDGPDGKQVPSFIGTLDYIFYQAPRYESSRYVPCLKVQLYLIPIILSEQCVLLLLWRSCRVTKPQRTSRYQAVSRRRTICHCCAASRSNCHDTVYRVPAHSSTVQAVHCTQP